MPYNITLTAGEMTVVLDNGDTQGYHLAEGTSVKVGVSRNPTHQTVSEPGAMAITFRESWFVLVRFSDASEPYRIWMGEVDNQPTWVNTQAGANQCRADVQASFA